MSKVKFVNAVHVIGVVSIVLFMQRSEAATFSVGGSKGWCVPSDNSSAVYNQWAERMRFQVGDSLLFVYPSGSDSVMQVSKEDYSSCTTTSPITKYTDGHTQFKFSKSGAYYFISGNKQNCINNEKLHVVVMADRTKTKTSSPPSPAPSVSGHEKQQQPPVVSPLQPPPATSPQQPPPVASPQQPPPVASPQQPPSATPAASPPSDGTSGLAPSAESYPPSSAASFAMSFVGSAGAFVASSLIMAF